MTATVSKASCVVLLLTALGSCAGAGAHPLTLWEVAGVHNRVYLLGSIHLLRESDYPIPTAIYAAYDDAERLVMELDMDDRDLAAIPALVAELGAIRGSQTLADLIGTDNYATVRRLAGELEIPTRLFEKSEPWLAAISTEVTLLMRAGFDPEKGIEQHFSDMAVADGKRIDGLETERQQLELLDRLTMQAQTTLLLQSMAEGAKLEATLDDLIHAWRNGDNGYLERTLLRDLHASRELYETLVVNRNRRWALQINALLDDGADYLVIVGALHLVGKHGLPVLLAADGWSVRQLAEPGAVKPAAADRP